jgi:NADPH:quinone reductase-like Zn-dependent oxidoreductase
MAAASIAAGHGITVAATTRSTDKALTADHVLIDDGESLAAAVRAIWPEGPSHVLDLIGARTAVDSLSLVRRGGTVCVSGSLSGWLIPDFEPIAMIPSGTRLTTFHSKDAAGTTALQRIVDEVEAGVYRPNLDRVFTLDEIAKAHDHMENNQATGKIVVIP